MIRAIFSKNNSVEETKSLIGGKIKVIHCLPQHEIVSKLLQGAPYSELGVTEIECTQELIEKVAFRKFGKDKFFIDMQKDFSDLVIESENVTVDRVIQIYKRKFVGLCIASGLGLIATSLIAYAISYIHSLI